MRVIFIGSTLLGLGILESVRTLEGIEVVGCVSAPQQFRISYSPTPVNNVLHADFTPICEQAGIPLKLMTEGMRDQDLLDWAAGLEPDAFLVVGWHHMIPQTWLDLAPAYALHASLLPDLAGGAPLVWALILGRTETGVTMFQMDSGVDSGRILGQRAFPIESRDTIKELLTKAEIAAHDLVLDQFARLIAGAFSLTHQDLESRHVVPQRSPADGQIDWHQTADEIDRLIRAITKPYPGAFSYVDGIRVNVWSAEPVNLGPESQSLELALRQILDVANPGSFALVGEELYVRCGMGTLRISEWEGSAAMTTLEAWSSGLRQFHSLE